MSKTEKIWIIVAASLVLVGCLIFGGIMMALDWNFLKLSTTKYDAKSYEITENFTSISVKTNTADVIVAPSEDGQCRVECYEQKKLEYLVSVKEGELIIELNDTRKWYERIGVDFESSKITVYVPHAEYDTVTVKSNTGSISVKELSFSALDLSVTTGKIAVSDITCYGDLNVRCSTGKVEIRNVNCKNLTSHGGTGDISLCNLIASGKLSIKRSTGDVRFEASDAAEILVNTDTGDVKGTLLTDKIFIARTDTGRIDVPKTVTGGKCEITTDTGDIKITVSAN